MDSVGQEQGIVPSAPALLHIHTTRAESNKRGLRGINCLTWEKRLNVAHHGPTMLLLWERGGKLLRFHTWCAGCWEPRNAHEGGYIRVNVNVGWAAPRGLHFYVLQFFLLFSRRQFSLVFFRSDTASNSAASLTFLFCFVYKAKKFTCR